MGTRPCQPLGRAQVLNSHPVKGLLMDPLNAWQDLAMHVPTEASTAPSALPALPPPTACATEGTQSGAAAITSHPTTHRAALAGTQPCGKTSAPGGERRNSQGPSAAASIHSRENQDVWNKASTTSCQQRVSSTSSLLRGSKVTGIGTCSSKGLLISSPVKHKDVGKPLPRGK